MSEAEPEQWSEATLDRVGHAVDVARQMLDEYVIAARSVVEGRLAHAGLEAASANVDEALWRLDDAVGNFSGDFFDSIEFSPEDEQDLTGSRDDPAAGTGSVDDPSYAVVWRLDVRVSDIEALQSKASALRQTLAPNEPQALIVARTSPVAGALQSVAEASGMDSLMECPGVSPSVRRRCGRWIACGRRTVRQCKRQRFGAARFVADRICSGDCDGLARAFIAGPFKWPSAERVRCCQGALVLRAASWRTVGRRGDRVHWGRLGRVFAASCASRGPRCGQAFL